MYRKSCLRDNFWRSTFWKTYFRKHSNVKTTRRKFKNRVTNRRGKKGPLFNLKKTCIINGFSRQKIPRYFFRKGLSHTTTAVVHATGDVYSQYYGSLLFPFISFLSVRCVWWTHATHLHVNFHLPQAVCLPGKYRIIRAAYVQLSAIWRHDGSSSINSSTRDDFLVFCHVIPFP